MDLLPLNFPVFYQCAVKGNTNLAQYDAVSVLLLGKLRKDCDDGVVIWDAEATGYTSGKRRLKKELFAQSTQISQEDARTRIEALGFQDTVRIAKIVRNLLSIVDLSVDARKYIEESPDEITLISSAFLTAIKCPAKKVFPLGLSEKKKIAFCYNEANINKISSDPNKKESFFEDISIAESGSATESNLPTELLDRISSARAIQEESQSSSSILPEEMGPVFCTYYIRDRSKKMNLFYELISTTVSAGITALSDLFGFPIWPELPMIEFCDDINYLIEHMFRNEDVKVFFEFFVGAVDCYSNPDHRDIHGIIVLRIKQFVLMEFYASYLKENPIQFLSYIQAFKYEVSMFGEIGSIFAGTVATAMSIFLDCPIIIREVDIPEVEGILNSDRLMVAGNLSFQFKKKEISGAGEILICENTLQKLSDLYEEQM